MVLEGRNLAGLLGVPEQTEHAGEVETELPGLQSCSGFVQQDERRLCFQCQRQRFRLAEVKTRGDNGGHNARQWHDPNPTFLERGAER